MQNCSRCHSGRAKSLEKLPTLHYLARGLYDTQEAFPRLNLCAERCKIELIRQHKMLPLGTHKAKDQLPHLGLVSV